MFFFLVARLLFLGGMIGKREHIVARGVIRRIYKDGGNLWHARTPRDVVARILFHFCRKGWYKVLIFDCEIIDISKFRFSEYILFAYSSHLTLHGIN